ncbi:UvrD-helicase domain-containing protein [Mucilaginibacter sp. UYCu711]|uniref:UvrD-helicase domain-containing protein n=1 Tax=Mucilaginibacter sp. UYCu711 TaxID=3156339 RepID=UPI003D21E1C9
MNTQIVQMIKERIEAKHSGDAHQLDVIFDPVSRLIVEAPAGYGKTNTMVSKIAYMIATGQIPNPKKLLALTFSVNAAYKIKKDVALQIPILLKETGLHFIVTDKIQVSNYHGFSRSILRKYGRLLHTSLAAIDTIKPFDDSAATATMTAVNGLTYEDAKFMEDFAAGIKSAVTISRANFDRYCSILIAKVLPLGLITYSGIIALTIKLFDTQPNILQFYHKFYTCVLIDEFQDTNYLCYVLCKRLITLDRKAILMGDPLQRIYGFIGAVPDLMNKAQADLQLDKKFLVKNYRFASNPQMLQLDQNIRRNAEAPRAPIIDKDAIVNLTVLPDHDTETIAVINQAITLVQQDNAAKVAVLFKQRGPNVNRLMENLVHNQIPFFNGLFTDDDARYLRFHKECLLVFLDLLRTGQRITKRFATQLTDRVKAVYKEENDDLFDSLLSLLEVFWQKFFVDYVQVNNEERIDLARDMFENNGLKQYLEFVQASVVLTTVHAAKGLEWEYVIIPDMEQDSFPNYNGGLCARGQCAFRANCQLVVSATNERSFLEELSVFYVAITRARREVYFFASSRDARSYPKPLSCFMKIPGIKY